MSLSTSIRSSSRLLVIGASGLVGRSLRKRLVGTGSVFTYNRNPFAGGVPFDPTRDRLSSQPWVRQGFSHAILLFANSKPDSCYADPEASWRVNYYCLAPLLEELSALAIQPVYFSTEFVFDGTRANSSEADIPNPILLYGQQKLQAEMLVLERSEKALVFRLAKVYGEERGDGTLFTAWLEALESGERDLRCAVDQAFSPVFIEDVCDAILSASGAGLSGLYHLSGDRRLTRMELLEILLSQVPQLSESVVRTPCSIRNFALPEPRPIDVSMSAAKLRSTGLYHPQSPEVTCERLIKEAIRSNRLFCP
jgi:dTDP-4-dehydrorhamnose reductase